MKNLMTALFLGVALFVPAPHWHPSGLAKPASSEKIAIVDINKADQAALQTVPGLGEAYSKKIIAARPYKSKDELWRKNVLPKGVYDKVKDYLVAKQPK
ncbi:MAG: helix-hairpin-helix domain-containing protein [Candidatus Eremiobacteraeota bacterium]|nr:helix-hairpin-helix domain-containing protein [Candidatus Eremiobacteraeota bacterium]MCW5871269.1 helix-hairpin-helix domain-containing protein [Candidatus Eremiobacteraeota bacterium]